MRLRCDQCIKPAMYNIQGYDLCLEHHTMLIKSIQGRQLENMAMMNYLQDSIAYTLGAPGAQPPRIQVPVPIVHTAPVTHNTHNNIHVENSVIGLINTAQVGRINVAMDNIVNNDDELIVEAIKAVTEAIVNTTELNNETKNQLLEQMAFITEQATLPNSKRQTSVVKPILAAISSSLTNIASLATVWGQWGDNIIRFFNQISR